ncbi:MAG: hypothetical protein AAGI38_19865 [Bacteroidota bacterium]
MKNNNSSTLPAKSISQRLDAFFGAIPGSYLITGVIILLVGLGIHNRFIQDDAFISFRYAKNFVDGHGLTWNVGDPEPVEGYTNFLWTMLMALGIALKIDPVLGSMVLGLTCGVSTLIFTYFTSLKTTQSQSLAVIATLLLGTNYTFSSYMTGGLETQLQAFLTIVSVYLTLRILGQSRRNLLLLLSLTFALAILNRLDAVLLCCILYVVVAIDAFKQPEKKIRNLIWLTFPAFLILITWFLMKYAYYGDILPNTFYVKAGSSSSLERGLIYTSQFFVRYGIILFVLIGLIYVNKIRTQFPFAVVLASLKITWICYVIKVSGGFMEFRLFVPIMPLLFIQIALILFFFKDWMKVFSVICMVSLSLYHAKTFEGGHKIESISQLHAHIVDEKENWQAVGRVLGELFGEADKPVVISTTAAGAIPFYSQLPTIDMLGLNDKWIAKNGMVIGSRPGHTRFATIEYLLESKVDLVIGHPLVRKRSSPPTNWMTSFFWGAHDLTQLPITSRIVEIPINAGYRIDVLYISDNACVDQLIKEHGFITQPLPIGR